MDLQLNDSASKVLKQKFELKFGLARKEKHTKSMRRLTNNQTGIVSTWIWMDLSRRTWSGQVRSAMVVLFTELFIKHLLSLFISVFPSKVQYRCFHYRSHYVNGYIYLHVCFINITLGLPFFFSQWLYSSCHSFVT